MRRKALVICNARSTLPAQGAGRRVCSLVPQIEEACHYVWGFSRYYKGVVDFPR